MSYKNVCLVLSLILVISSTSALRGLPRLDSSATLGDCWNALVEIKSCSNEIILFFVKGETDIGTDCCRSIAIITHNCWPAMLSSLGFTSEQGDILRGYCDNSASTNSLSPSIAPSPAFSVV